MHSPRQIGPLGFVGLATLIGLGSGCQTESPLIDGVFTDSEMAAIKTLGPLPPPDPDTTNRYADNPQAALLGQKLFFDPGYSGAIVVGNDGTNGGLVVLRHPPAELAIGG